MQLDSWLLPAGRRVQSSAAVSSHLSATAAGDVAAADDVAAAASLTLPAVWPAIRRQPTSNSSARGGSDAFLASDVMQQLLAPIKAAVKAGSSQLVWSVQSDGGAAGAASPYYHYGCEVTVCVPHLNPLLAALLPDDPDRRPTPACPHCSLPNYVTPQGFHSAPAYVYGVSRHGWYLTYKYQCSNPLHSKPERKQSTTFTLTEGGFDCLPAAIRAQLPIVRINKFWYSKQLVSYLLLHRLSTSLRTIHMHLQQSREEEFQRRFNAFKSAGGNVNEFATKAVSTEYGESEVPAESTLQEIYISAVQSKYGADITRHFDALTSDVYMADACESVLANVRYTAENGKRQKPYKALYTIMCARTHRVVYWKLVTSTSHAELKRAWDGLKQRHLQLGQQPPDSVCIDNCCTDRSMLVSVFPGIKVALDVWHGMSRIAKTLASTHHPQFGMFMRLFSKILYGEVSMPEAERKQRIVEHRRRLAPQQQLLAALDDYFARWAKAPATSPLLKKWQNVPLFTATTWPAWLNLRQHISLGCLHGGDFDVDSRSFASSSPLEALHRSLKAAFHGASVQGTDVWLQHYFYRWNERRQAEQSIVPPPPAHPLQQPARPWRTLDQMGVEVLPTAQAFAAQLQQSTDQVLAMVTSAKLSDEQARAGIAQLVAGLQAAASYASTAVAARDVGMSSLAFLSQNAVSYITTTDSWSVDELALLKYLRADPRYAALFSNGDWDALTAVWWDITYKARAASRSSGITLKTAESINLQVVRLDTAAAVSEYLSTPSPMKRSSADPQQVYDRLEASVNKHSVEWSNAELRLLATLTGSLNSWDTIMAKWKEQVMAEINSKSLGMRARIDNMAVRPRTLNSLKAKQQFVKTSHMKKEETAAKQRMVAWVQQAVPAVESALTAMQQQPAAAPASPIKKRSRQLTSSDRRRLVELCRANLMTSGEVNATAVAGLAASDTQLKWFNWTSDKVSRDYHYAVKKLKMM